MKKIFIVTLCIIEVVLIFVLVSMRSANNNTIEETPVVKPVVVKLYNNNLNQVTIELLNVTEENRSEIFSQVKTVVGRCYEPVKMREELESLNISVGQIDVHISQPTFMVKAYDKQGYDYHIELYVLDSKASKEEATAKIQSYYAGLSKAEASDVNKAYLNELIGEGFVVSRFFIFAEAKGGLDRI